MRHPNQTYLIANSSIVFPEFFSLNCEKAKRRSQNSLLQPLRALRESDQVVGSVAAKPNLFAPSYFHRRLPPLLPLSVLPGKATLGHTLMAMKNFGNGNW